jgi:hypothetical protein
VISPVSSRLSLVGKRMLQGAVLCGVVGQALLPAVPNDVEPGTDDGFGRHRVIVAARPRRTEKLVVGLRSSCPDEFAPSLSRRFSNASSVP